MMKSNQEQPVGRTIMPISLIVDGDNYVFTHWAGTGGEQSSADALMRLARDYQDRYNATVHVAFDAPGKTWRHDLYNAYKGQRGAKDEAVVAEMELARRVTEHNGWLLPPEDGLEADDLVAIATTERVAAGDKVVILSRDKDCRQLLLENRVSMLVKASSWRGEWSYRYFTAGDLLTETGLTPAQWPDYRALTGDPSDNWPGAKGIGPKTAQAILRKAGSLAAAMDNLWSLPITGKQQDTLARFDWRLGLLLMTLRRSRRFDATAAASVR
jgi:DNA polymerase-1